MPNIAIALKSEISRLARKEIRAETGSLKKAASQYRSQLAALKRRVETLERQLRRTRNQPSSKTGAGTVGEEVCGSVLLDPRSTGSGWRANRA